MKKIDADNVEDILSITPMQSSMLYASLMNADEKTYVEQNVINIKGDLDVKVLEQAIDCVGSDNEMLRTVFRWGKLKKPVQVILKEKKIPVQVFDLTKEEEKEQRQNEIVDMVRKKINFTDCLLLFAVCKKSEDEYSLIVNNHHIIMDGWSMSLLIGSILSVYTKIKNHYKIEPVYKCKYRDYIKFLYGFDRSLEKEFWSAYLENMDFLERKDFEKNELSSKGQKISFKEIEGAFLEKVKEYIAQNHITMASLFYSVWGINLSKYENREEVVFGITFSGREESLKGIENTIGLFINTIPVRMHISKDCNYNNLVKQTNSQVIELQEHQFASLNEILTYSNSNIPFNASVFKSVMVVQNYPVNPELLAEKDGLKLSLNTRPFYTGLPLVISVRNFETLIVEFAFQLSEISEKMTEKIMEDFMDTLKTIVMSE